MRTLVVVACLVSPLLSFWRIQGFLLSDVKNIHHHHLHRTVTKARRDGGASLLFSTTRTSLDGLTSSSSSTSTNRLKSWTKSLLPRRRRNQVSSNAPVSVITLDYSSDQDQNMSDRTTDDQSTPGATTVPATTVLREITTVEELDELWKEDDDDTVINPKELCPTISVKGDTQIIGSPDHPHLIHPVVKMLHDRRRELHNKQKLQSAATTSNDKVALVIEGGGMRGCVTAGMVCAIDYLGLRDCVDVVYGSSAGSVIGASFITGQLPWFGPETYYDQLTAETAGKSFIDTTRLFRALGLGLLNPRLLKDVLVRRNAGKPVLNLHYLLQQQVQSDKRLDWDTFVKRQTRDGSSKSGEKHQPLNVVASAMKSERPLSMNYNDGHFQSLEELAQCMHASCLLPGIAGPVVNILTSSTASSSNGGSSSKPKFVMRNNLNDPDYEPLADALIYAPIPYEVAQHDGATHMIVLRSKPDGADVIGKGGSVGETLVWSRFFLRKNSLKNVYERLKQQIHKRVYAKNVLELNEASRIVEGDSNSKSSGSSNSLPPTLTVAISPEFDEIARLESDREAIFEGVRQGFARAYDSLVEDPAERGNGYEVAKVCFPDEILDYSPLEMYSNHDESSSSSSKSNDDDDDTTESSFERYMKRTKIWPKAWEGHDEAPVRKIYNDEPAPLPTSSTPRSP
mmetsp:Transcript_25035/g.59502  ORF Transcript_25035/g.59502 Transcript_25035/m.59502 type:complete len:682 (-) Transcript_25035:72-2117(-)